MIIDSEFQIKGEAMHRFLLALVLLLVVSEAEASSFGFIPQYEKGSVVMLAAPMAPGVRALAAPSVNVESVGNQVVLTWTLDPNAKSYNVYWSTDNKKPLANKLDNQKNTKFEHTALTPNTSYFYTVVAVDDNDQEGTPFTVGVVSSNAQDSKQFFTSIGSIITAEVPKLSIDLANYCMAFADKSGKPSKDHCYPLSLKTTQQVKNSLAKANFSDSFLDEDGGVANLKIGWRYYLYKYSEDTLSGINIELNGGAKLVEGLKDTSTNDTSFYTVGQAVMKLYGSFPIFDTNKPIIMSNKVGALSIGVSAIGDYSNSATFENTFNSTDNFNGHIEGLAQLYITDKINIKLGGTIANTNKQIDNRYFFTFAVER